MDTGTETYSTVIYLSEETEAGGSQAGDESPSFETEQGPVLRVESSRKSTCHLPPRPCIYVALSSHLNWTRIIRRLEKREPVPQHHWVDLVDFGARKETPQWTEALHSFFWNSYIHFEKADHGPQSRFSAAVIPPPPIRSGEQEMDPQDEKLLDHRLNSMEKAIADGFKHQTELLDVRMGHLTDWVKKSTEESAAVKKDYLDNNRWWTRLLVVALFFFVTAFAGMFYYMSNLSQNMTRDLRKDFDELRYEFHNSAQKAQPRR